MLRPFHNEQKYKFTIFRHGRQHDKQRHVAAARHPDISFDTVRGKVTSSTHEIQTTTVTGHSMLILLGQ